jgi:hypothetical protein
VLWLSAVLVLSLGQDQHLYSLQPLWVALLVLQLQQPIQFVSLLVEETMAALALRQLVQLASLQVKEPTAAMALQQRVQLVSILVQEPTVATHHTPPKPRLRLL